MNLLTLALAILAVRFIYKALTQRLRPVVGEVKLQDGDSLTIGSGTHVLRCRLAGIDAPEWNSPGGKAARKMLGRLVETKGPISYRPRGRDKFGRTLVTLYGANGADLNQAMVEEGHARAYARYSWSYLAAERRARKAGRGNWRSGDFVAPELVRHGQ